MQREGQLTKKNWLKKGEHIKGVLSQRWKVYGQQVVFFMAKNEVGYPRLGLAPGKKYGNAVARNLWKRICREAFRKSLINLQVGIDLVLFPKKGCLPEVAQLSCEFVGLNKEINKEGNFSTKKNEMD